MHFLRVITNFWIKKSSKNSNVFSNIEFYHMFDLIHRRVLRVTWCLIEFETNGKKIVSAL